MFVSVFLQKRALLFSKEMIKDGFVIKMCLFLLWVLQVLLEKHLNSLRTCRLRFDASSKSTKDVFKIGRRGKHQ